MSARALRLLGTALIAFGAASCAVGPNYRTPKVVPPEHFADASTAGRGPPAATPGAVDMARWWHALGDRELDSLVERAIADNPDVLIALDRLQAARVYETASFGAVLPTVGASAAAARGTGSDLTRGRAAQPLIAADNSAGYQHINEIAGFDALWELDIFGKYRREIEAVRDDAQATLAARNGVLVAIVSDVARAYVDLRGLQMRAQVLNAAITTLRESLRIVSIRYERGITNELDVTLATREIATLESQAAPLDAQIRSAEYSLATLLGQFPEQLAGELDEAHMVPDVPSSVEPGLPLDLLRRRPDIEQAERQLAGATARIGVATADLFPSLAVSGAAGFQRQVLGINPQLSNHIWSAGIAAAWPLLDFGALDARVESADLEARALLVNYKKTIQQAVREVDTSLAKFSADQVSLDKLGIALQASQRAVTLANERYERGLTDFLNVVDAERQEYDIEEQFSEAQVAAAEEFVALYRALGGGWENYQDLPPVHRPEPAVIAAFQRLSRRDAPTK
jgi:NodT family efflux transporter outer membrane factor (OMF) lipoprotein